MFVINNDKILRLRLSAITTYNHLGIEFNLQLPALIQCDANSAHSIITIFLISNKVHFIGLSSKSPELHDVVGTFQQVTGGFLRNSNHAHVANSDALE